MNKYLKFTIITTFLILLGIINYISRNYVNPAMIKKHTMGKVIRSYEFVDINSNKTYFKENFYGQKYIIMFYNSFCGICHRQGPYINKIRAKYPNFKLFGLIYRDSVANIKNDLNNFSNPFDMVFIDNHNRLANHLDVMGIPEFLVVDEKGIVQFHYLGSLNDAVVRNFILPALNNRVN